MKVFILIILILINSCFIENKTENNINQEEIINNFELDSTDNYKLISKKALIKDNSYYLEDIEIYFGNIFFYSSKSKIINENIYSENLNIKTDNFIIKSRKSIYKNKIFKLEKVKAKF